MQRNREYFLKFDVVQLKWGNYIIADFSVITLFLTHTSQMMKVEESKENKDLLLNSANLNQEDITKDYEV